MMTHLDIDKKFALSTTGFITQDPGMLTLLQMVAKIAKALNTSIEVLLK